MEDALPAVLVCDAQTKARRPCRRPAEIAGDFIDGAGPDDLPAIALDGAVHENFECVSRQPPVHVH